MTYKITVTNNSYQVKVDSQKSYKIGQSNILEIMPVNLNELTDVEITGNPDKYVLMYDATKSKWKNVNPDDVLIASVNETVSPGIPDPFVDELDIDLDNRIDLDAGTF